MRVVIHLIAGANAVETGFEIVAVVQVDRIVEPVRSRVREPISAQRRIFVNVGADNTHFDPLIDRRPFSGLV